MSEQFRLLENICRLQFLNLFTRIFLKNPACMYKGNSRLKKMFYFGITFG